MANKLHCGYSYDCLTVYFYVIKWYWWPGIVIGVIGDRYWWPGMHGRAYPAPVIGMYVKVPEAAGLASPQDIGGRS